MVLLLSALILIFGSSDSNTFNAREGSLASAGCGISSYEEKELYLRYGRSTYCSPRYKVENEVVIEKSVGEERIEEATFKEEATVKEGAVGVAKEVKLVLSFAGDCTLGTDEDFAYANSFPEVLKRQNNDYSYFFSGVRHIFEGDDLTLVNLETTLTKAANKAGKTFRFKGKPDYVNILKAGSVEMVNISNNHIHDYLQQGFDETLQTLKSAGVAYSGEGNIAYYYIKGKKIASIGYTGWDMSITKSLRSNIQKARQNADLVIVSFHWGKERTYYPDSVQTKLGRFSIDAGADIVLGHHPHVIQGIELYKGRYIVYSLGNFCFGGNSNPTDKDSMIFRSEFTFEDEKLIDCSGEIIPCSISSVSYINDYRPVVLEGARGQKVLDRIYKYSKDLKFGIRPGSAF